MAKQTLRVTIVLGILITLVSGTGIFALFTDRATTGTASVSSGQRAPAADLKITLASPVAVNGSMDCDPDLDGIVGEDDLAGPLFTASDIQPGETANVTYLCLRNAGSGALDVAATVTELADTDLGCTGDELQAGDSCDQPGDAGELSSFILIDYDVLDCAQVAGSYMILAAYTEAPASYAATPWAFTGASYLGAPMDPGAIVCLRVISRYNPSVTEAQAQMAQSDQTSWRFAFDATAQ